MIYSTLSDLKPDLGIELSDTSRDQQLNRLLKSASQTVRNYLGYDLSPATYTEVRDGNDTPFLRLYNLPVRSVSRVWLDLKGSYGTAAGAFADDTLLEEGVDWALRPDQPDGSSLGGLLARLNGVWPGRPKSTYRNRLALPRVPGLGNVRIEYTAGYCPIPEDIKTAIHTLVGRMVKSIPNGGVMLSSERLGQYSYTLQSIQSMDPLDPVRASLSAYRRQPV